VPLLSVTPSTIPLSPTQIVLDFDVDPNGTPLAGVTFFLESLAAGLEIVDVQGGDAEILGSSGLNGGNYEGSFIGVFGSDRSAPFSVGTVTLEGLTPGTPLVLLGSSSFLDSGFNDIFIGPLNVANVVSTPEPGTAALLGLGIAGLAAVGRRRI
jgi:hypothetical protein